MGLEDDDADVDSGSKVKGEGDAIDTKIVMHDEEATTCPLCSASLAGITDQVCLSRPFPPFSSNPGAGSLLARQRLSGWQAFAITKTYITHQVRIKPTYQEGKDSSAQTLSESSNCTTRPGKPIWTHNHTRNFNVCLLYADVWPRRGRSMGECSSS